MAKTLKVKKSNYRRKREFEGRLYASLPLITFAIFGVIPLLISLFLSFGNLYTFDIRDWKFVGFENYIRIFKEDKQFLKSILNTFVFAFVTVFLQLFIALIISLSLNVNIKGKRIFRTILFIPYVCSMVAISVMWKWIFDANYGVLNDIVEWFGGRRVAWLFEENTAMPVIMAMSIWMGLGYNIILYSASLTTISKTYYEAAEVDGASKFQQFLHVTLPSIRPTTFFLLIMGFIGALQNFTIFIIMTPGGGPNYSTLTMGLRLFQVAFGDDSYLFGMGYASAMGWVIGSIVMIFVALYFYINKKREGSANA